MHNDQCVDNDDVGAFGIILNMGYPSQISLYAQRFQ